MMMVKTPETILDPYLSEAALLLQFFTFLLPPHSILVDKIYIIAFGKLP